MNAWYMAADPRIGKYVSGSTIQSTPKVPATARNATQTMDPVISSPLKNAM
ncbi:hypothetical protein [Arthrobacter sp. S41]|uniref:hypothetical protein n=1 Tax=Arthrobacter sp. S41 TaxID=2509721 RepID=UPI00325B6A97